jgi:poly(hydroxyalkanoate) depolymerase family esterase
MLPARAPPANFQGLEGGRPGTSLGRFAAWARAALQPAPTLALRQKLYRPPGTGHDARPLVVMLHGCSQGAVDFAAATAMNQRAREQGYFVLYPEQSRNANALRCWSWYKPQHQQRGRGEPAAIAAMTQAVIRSQGIDPSRVYIAGMSDGGAMATIVAAAYPDIFAAVGVHSGVARGAASNATDARGVMRGNIAAGRWQTAPKGMPTIVFQGDQDVSVHPRHGRALIAASLGQPSDDQGLPAADLPAQVVHVVQGIGEHGRHYTRAIHEDGAGHVLAEHWLVHGAGHAWSGGQTRGSFADTQGPDASREMLRFFSGQRRRNEGIAASSGR